MTITMQGLRTPRRVDTVVSPQVVEPNVIRPSNTEVSEVVARIYPGTYGSNPALRTSS